VRRPAGPAIALVVLGALLVLGPIAGGLFSKVADGKQMIDAFRPHMEADALARYRTDLDTLRAGAAGIDAVYQQEGLAAGTFPGIDAYRSQAASIDRRATALLDRVTAAEPSYRKVARIGGFDRIPFLLVLCGIVTTYGGCVLLGAGRGRARAAAALVVLASVAVAAYPFVSDLHRGTHAGHQMVRSFTPIMTAPEVRQLQGDFVVVVHAVGELDTRFRAVPQSGPPAAQIATLVQDWPKVSSDLASLVGTIQDDLSNFRALEDLDRATHGLGVSGLEAFPWVLVGIGGVSGALSIAAWPRRVKETG
jgi:hypothetical protein